MSSTIPPRPGEVHLWLLDLSPSGAASARVSREWLDAAEAARAETYTRPDDRRRFVLAHASLRAVLAGYAGRPPADLVFRQGPRGKPELACGTVRFNLSHSGDMAVCAVSGDAEVGVDVERERPAVEGQLLGLLSSAVRERFQALPEPERRKAFLAAWCRMEACAKASGLGLDSGLETLERFVDPAADPAELSFWWIRSFVPRPGYAGAVASPGGKRGLRFMAWRHPSYREAQG